MKKILITEAQASGKMISYHYSNSEFNIGQILDSPIGNERRLNSKTEEDLENARLKYNPTAPNRLTCLYSAPYRKNRFSRLGKNCYLVEVIGNYFVGDSRLVDELMQTNINLKNQYLDNELKNDFLKDKQYDEKQYWIGKLGEKKDIEIISDKLKVLQKITFKPLKFKVVNDLIINIHFKQRHKKHWDILIDSNLINFITDDNKIENEKVEFIGMVTLKNNTIFETIDWKPLSNDNPQIKIEIQGVNGNLVDTYIVDKKYFKKCQQLN